MENKLNIDKLFFRIRIMLFNSVASGTYIYQFWSNVSLMLLPIISHAIKFSTLKFQSFVCSRLYFYTPCLHVTPPPIDLQKDLVINRRK